MHHYPCQNVYIADTASERIVDTLEFPPHNFPIPQLSSTDRLIMAAKDMSNALKNPHPEVPFSHIGDDTISALTKVAEIFKTKFQKVQSQGLPNAPAMASEHTIPANLSHPILASPVHQQHQTIS
jgi:predicted RNase H-like nuclease